MYRKLIFGREIGLGVYSWCDLDFDHGPWLCQNVFLLPLFRHISPNTKICGLLQLIIICTLT